MTIPRSRRPRPTAPRVGPQDEAQWGDDARAVFAQTRRGGGHPYNIFTTIAHHPKMLGHWWAFGGALFGPDARLPARDRELLILRTGWNCDAEYEWGQHVLVGRTAGLSDDEIRRITEGPDAPGWDPFEATLLRAADELHGDSCISDATWAALSARYGTEQLIEVLMVVGQYHLVSMALNSLGVQLDDGLPGFPA